MKQLKKILLIDDDASINFLHSEVLKHYTISANYELMDSSKAAMEAIQNSKAQELPDLILLDLNMPVFNGWDFLDEMSVQIEAIQKIPTVILTSSVNPDDIEQSKGYTNVIGFLSKPLDVEELTELMKLYRASTT